MRKLIITSFFILAGILGTNTAMATEEPKYEIVLAEGDFEIRHYAPILIAETEVDGDMDEASSKGFRLIADFIFGNNQALDSEQGSKIAMTVPVTVEPKSARISMTAPVTVEPQAGVADMMTANKWRIHFVMPSQYSLATIPRPKNQAVKLREVPSKYYLVHKYSGLNTLAKVQNKTDEALLWAQQKSLKMVGTPQLSRYNPPWTLPMFRRNEIMIEILAP